VTQEIVDHRPDRVEVLLHKTERLVATHAQETAHLIRLVVVIDVWRGLGVRECKNRMVVGRWRNTAPELEAFLGIACA